MESDAARAERSASVAAAQSVRMALQALLKEVRRSRLYGGPRVAAVESRFSSMYLAAMSQGLAQQPVLLLSVLPDALRVGEVEVLSAAEAGDIPNRLYAEGARSISVELGATELELIALANLLATPWGEGQDEGLIEAVWLADLNHVAFEMVERVGEAGDPDDLGDSPLVHSLSGLVEEMNRQTPEEVSRIRQDEFLLLRRLQEELGGGEDVADVRPALVSALSPSLRAEVLAACDGEDLVGLDLLAVLAACATAVDEPAILPAMLALVVEALEAQEPDDTRPAALRSCLDEGIGGAPGLEARFSDWAMLSAPLRARLAAVAYRRGEGLSGALFTVFGLLESDASRAQLAAELPIWAVRVLADAWLAEDPPAEPATVARQLLASREPAQLRLGLALARRLDHQPLVEPISALLAHPNGEMREQALFGLRRYSTPRLREMVGRLLEDPEEPVRLECLRYVVAYRVVEFVGRLEARLVSVPSSRATDLELRALAISIARLLRDRGEAHLIPVALGARAAAHPFAPAAALHGLRAIGTPSARSAIARIGAEVPALEELSRELLGGTR